jgi:NADPH:quinone reductase-like Zn-dependent oxidoreductase
MGKFAKLAACPPAAGGAQGKTDRRERSEGEEQMEAYRIDRFGSVGGIVRHPSEDPRPGLREVLMRVRANSLNYRDLMVLKGCGRGPTKLGVVPLSDGGGEVAAVGEGATRVKVGDHCRDVSSALVWRTYQAGIPHRPAWRQSRRDAGGIRRAEREALVQVPNHLSFEEAATLPCAAVTAWVAPTGHRRVGAGGTVLTQTLETALFDVI